MECQAKEDVDNDKFSKTSRNFSGMAAQHLSMELCFTFYYLYRLNIFGTANNLAFMIIRFYPVVLEYQFATSQRH